jgi:hypothetical protein
VCKFCSFQNQWTNCRCRCVANLKSLRYPKPEREPAMCMRALFFSKETCYETMLSLSLCFTLRNRQHNKMFLEDDMCAHPRSFSSKNTLQTRLYHCLLNHRTQTIQEVLPCVRGLSHSQSKSRHLHTMSPAIVYKTRPTLLHDAESRHTFQ